jgi:NTP pyrophosphatase (non-canonical NTP hydrolase)
LTLSRSFVLPFTEIDSDSYVAAAVRTEAPYDEAIERVGSIGALHHIRTLFERSRQLGVQQNALKKFLFYGVANGLGIDPTIRARGADLEAAGRLGVVPVIRLLHAAIGLQTEASELQDQLLAHIFHGRPLDLVNCAEETGDALWYAAIIGSVAEMNLTQILQQNIAKLTHRYPDKFSHEAAINRDLEGERRVLESTHNNANGRGGGQIDHAMPEPHSVPLEQLKEPEQREHQPIRAHAVSTERAAAAKQVKRKK